VEGLTHIAHWLVAMALLAAVSAFFSASEAALFLLRPIDRRRLASGNRSQRAAARLLEDPDRLLSSVLFWNLSVNVTYFTIASLASIQLGGDESGGSSVGVVFGFTSLMVIIFTSELLPKSLAVLRPPQLAAIVGLPLSIFVRMVDPIMPSLRLVNLLSQRLIWPGFKPEPYLEVNDLERAIELSTSDASLVEQERAVLHSIVSLSESRADELMRPRLLFQSFRPPVSLSDLEGQIPRSGYLLVTEPKTDEVVGAIHLESLFEIPAEHLEHHTKPVLYVPWSMSVADVFHTMQDRHHEVAAVVNEFGETIGILTFEDILDTIFTQRSTRSDRLLNRQSIQQQDEHTWMVTGVATLRRLARHFHVSLPASKSVTAAGIVQETLERLPQPGDQCDWGPFHFNVIDAPERGQLTIELTLRTNGGADE